MILRLDCPLCNKDSYSAIADDFRPCPYCGVLFSGKYGLEKRNALRTKKEFPFVFAHKKQSLGASTINFSQDGLCVWISGGATLPVGEIVDLTIQNSSAKAQIRWIKTEPDSSFTMAGLQIVEGKLH